MRGTNLPAIYVLWLREMKRLRRSKSRIVGMAALPLFFLVGLGYGMGSVRIGGAGGGVSYLQFLVPGVVGMTMLFAASFGGLSVLWDRQFGFLKEILVTPVDRVSIVLGRMAGSVTTALIQGVLILAVSAVVGFRPDGVLGLVPALGFMALIGTTFVGLGLLLASRIDDVQAFNLLFNFVLLPLLFLSGAIYPIENLPSVAVYLAYANPLTYGVDGLRGVLVGVSTFDPLLDFVVMVGFAAALVVAGAVAFDRSSAV